MPRPATKKDLINTSNEQFNKMWELISQMSNENLEFSFEITEKDKEAHWRRDKNLRDVLVHLYEWHQLVINWVKNNQNSDTVTAFLPSPYNWRNYGNMNVVFWEKHQNTSLQNAKEMLMQSHKDVLDIIANFTNEELFEKAHFKWSGSTNIGSYFVSSTYSHYDWAMKKIKRQIKAL